MDGTIFGMYDFENDTLVDLTRRDSGGDVFMHEYTHHIISTFSSLGLLLNMMKKASPLAPEKQWLFEALVELVQKVQEVTAVHVEYYHIYNTRGKEAFERATCHLGENNPEYFRHFRSLYDIHSLVHDRDGANHLIVALLGLAIQSMNLDLSDFPLWTFQSKRDLETFLDRPGMRECWHPKSRFDTLVKYTLRQDHSDTAEARLSWVMHASCQEENPTRQCYEAAMKIYQDSPHYDRIVKRIRTISLNLEKFRHFDGVRGTSLLAYPVDLNTDQLKRTYLLADLPTCIHLLNKRTDCLLIFSHVRSGYEHQTTLLCAGPTPETTLCRYTMDDLPDLLSLPNQIVFTRGKLFRRLKPRLRRCWKRPYILMDSAMAGNLDFILQEFEGGRYTYFVQERYIVLLIFNSQYTLFQPIVQEALQDASTLLQIHQISYVEFAVSGFYGDPAPRLLARYNQETASDARLLKQWQEEYALTGKL